MICVYSKCRKEFKEVRSSHKYCSSDCSQRDRQFNKRYELAEKRILYRAKKKANLVLEVKNSL